VNYLAEASMVLALSLPAPAPAPAPAPEPAPEPAPAPAPAPVAYYSGSCSGGSCYPVYYPSNYSFPTPIYRRR
jgi:hypothetical protein